MNFVKTIEKRDGTKSLSKKDIKVGKTKSATSKRVVPLNKTAIDMIIKLREERYITQQIHHCHFHNSYLKILMTYINFLHVYKNTY